MRQEISFLACALAAVPFMPSDGRPDTARWLQKFIEIPGVSGYETRVREAVEILLPASARVGADNLGNIVLRTGTGVPHTLIVAPLDESGVIISAITADGYLRVHRDSTAPGPRLSTQHSGRGGVYLSLDEAHPVLVPNLARQY
jgi:hypothetical protein